MKRVVAVSVLAIAGITAAVLAFIPIPGGPLADGGNTYGGPLLVGSPFTAYYELVNTGNRELEIENVSLGEHTTGLELVTTFAQPRHMPSLAPIWPGFPPRKLTRGGLRPVEGLVLGAHSDAPVLIGLEAQRPGTYRLEGIEVEYRVRLVGKVGPRFRRRITTSTVVCVQLVRLPAAGCRPFELAA
ncbi:MAG TPA: hypothetical protein VFL41_10100 [Gaiellaceae bacterium]|nr:hypothetical protein [Gaiellaceae bacterium]